LALAKTYTAIFQNLLNLPDPREKLTEDIGVNLYDQQKIKSTAQNELHF